MSKYFLILMAIGCMLTGCKKEQAINAEFTEVDPSVYSHIKFINAFPYATPVFSGQTSAAIQLSFNGFQLSATPIGVGGVFPASPNYAAVQPDPGSQFDFAVRLALGVPQATVRDSLLFNFKPVMQRGKYYSYFFYDSIGKATRILAVEDDINTPARDIIRVRFANLIPNPPVATPNIDVFSTVNNTVIFSNIPYRTITPFIEVPRLSTASTNNDTYIIRWAGTTTTIASATVTLQSQSSYTLVARGFVGASGGRAPGLTQYRNR